MTPNIYGCKFVGSVVLSICRCILVLYSAGSDVNSMQFVMSGLSMRLSFVHMCILSIWLYVGFDCVLLVC